MTTQNYFTLFELPVEYLVDESLLKQSYTNLISKHHPDNFASDETNSIKALEYTTLINTAYKTLSDPVQRGAYLLSLNGINAFDEYDTQMSSEFIIQQIELQETLETLQDEQSLEDFLEEIHSQVDEYSNQIANSYANSDFEEVKTQVHELKFYQQLQSITEQKLDAFI